MSSIVVSLLSCTVPSKDHADTAAVVIDTADSIDTARTHALISVDVYVPVYQIYAVPPDGRGWKMMLGLELDPKSVVTVVADVEPGVWAVLAYSIDISACTLSEFQELAAGDVWNLDLYGYDGKADKSGFCSLL